MNRGALGGGIVRAWHVAQGHGDPYGGHMLVYAETRGQAKSLAIARGLYEYDFKSMTALRAKLFDGLFQKPRVITSNKQLFDAFKFHLDLEGDYIES